MKHQIKPLSNFVQKMQSDGETGSGLFFVAETELPKENILESIQELTDHIEIDQPIAVLSEAHQKPRIKSPSGTVVASSQFLLPEVMDAAPNCGMRVVKTDLKTSDLTPEKIDQLFKVLKKAIPTGGLAGTIITKEMVAEIFRKGSSALEKKFTFDTEAEIENTYENGNFFSPPEHQLLGNPLQGISPLISWIAKFRLNLLGATNSHFLQLAKVSEITDPEKAAALGLKEGQYVFFMHTGSSIVGRYVASLYTPRKIKSFLQKNIIAFLRKTCPRSIQENLPNTKDINQKNSTLFAYEQESLPGKMFFSALGAVSNYGFANRALITQSLSQTLENFFERKINLALLYDAPHVFLSRETQAGKTLWIHRNGANRAYGPSMLSNHPVFSKTGEPVLVAPFEGTDGYIGVGTDENFLTYYSANHEIGKVSDLNITPNQYQQHGEKIIAEMEKNNMIKMVAKVTPLKVLTYEK